MRSRRGRRAAASTTSANAQHRFVRHHPVLRHGIFQQIADYLGLTPPQVMQQLRSGKSLAEIAAAQGKTVDGLKTTILDAIKARLDKAVAANRLSSTQEQTFLSKVQARLDTFVNRHFGHHSP